jgi:hypothetical protein
MARMRDFKIQSSENSASMNQVPEFVHELSILREESARLDEQERLLAGELATVHPERCPL